jgi:hypothetical protein
MMLHHGAVIPSCPQVLVRLEKRICTIENNTILRYSTKLKGRLGVVGGSWVRRRLLDICEGKAGLG